MTRDQYIERVRLNFEGAGDFYGSIDFTDSIQDCYDEIAVLSGCIIKGVQIPIQPGLSFYDLRKFIPDYWAVVAIYCSTGAMWLSPSSKREVESLRWDWTKQSGTPLLFYPVNHRYIAIYPRPNSVSDRDIFYVFYRATSNTLGGSDIPQFPQEYFSTLESFITADLFEQQLEFTKAGVYFTEYQKHLAKLSEYIRQQKNPDRLFTLDEPQPTGGFMRPY